MDNIKIYNMQLQRPEDDHLVVETYSRATRLIKHTKRFFRVIAKYPAIYLNTKGYIWQKN
jgi:hypothetical protein